jgi:cytochrome c oxidase cbb3-type subunit 4
VIFMDINTLRVAVTVVSLVLFLALVLHSWSRRRAQEYRDAALLPFTDEPGGASSTPHDNTQGARS